MRGLCHAPAAFYPQEGPGTHCTGGWVGPRAGLDRLRKISPPPGFDSRTVQPVASRYTDWATRPTGLNVSIWNPNYRLSNCVIFFFVWRNSPPVGHGLQIHEVYRSHTQWCTAIGRTPLNEWSARHRDFYLTTHNTTQQTDTRAPCGIRTHNLSRRTAAVLSLIPRGHWDRQLGS
jgi:hypothetical protein